MNGGTLISFAAAPPAHPKSQPRSAAGGANFTFQLANTKFASKKNSNSAERRANHNAVERARRECLNVKFQDLAHALPALNQTRRPSKSIIVQKSLEFISNTRQRELLNEKEISSLRNENDDLRKQLNELRAQIGLAPLPEPVRAERPPPLTLPESARSKRSYSEDDLKSEGSGFTFDGSTGLHTSPEGQQSTEDDDGSNSDDNDFDYDSGDFFGQGGYTAATTTNPTIVQTTPNFSAPFMHPGSLDFVADMTAFAETNSDGGSTSASFDDLKTHQHNLAMQMNMANRLYSMPNFDAGILDMPFLPCQQQPEM